MNQPNLFQKYCIDACAILDFWEIQNKTRPYHVKVRSFRVIWEHISKGVENGSIIVPKIVAEEIKLVTNNPELQAWLKKNEKKFWDQGGSIQELRKIVSKHDIYTKTKGSLADAVLIAIAMTHNLTVITQENYVKNQSMVNPKIPNVCEEFSVKWLNLPEFFEVEGL